MDKNVKIAKELVRLAKSLVSFEDEKTAAWNWKHPFTFDENSQNLNELEDKIKKGEITDTILVNLVGVKTKYEDGGKVEIYDGKNDRSGWRIYQPRLYVDVKCKVIAPEGADIKLKDMNLNGTMNSCKLSYTLTARHYHSSCDLVDHCGKYKVIWRSLDSSLEVRVNEYMNNTSYIYLKLNNKIEEKFERGTERSY